MIFNSRERKLLGEIRMLSDRLAEDKIYAQAMEEIETNEVDPVAQAKALEEAEGDAQKGKAFYIKHRVRRIRDLATEYEIWLVQEQSKKEEVKETKENKRQELDLRKRLSSVLAEGDLPPIDVQKTYRDEFAKFYKGWSREDYARRYLPKASAWREFLRRKGLI